ncbi:hypothetical protein Lesp02_84000 [Lentzea sp. NBRC 105346]|uniref:hypothetical protein n=1 Tax=Lentzea sp. NBRC 105346 TaxID=3032205 RepID=UPI00249FACD8|nr:hypothetical protein [Lentzea sp. NBRC 105346]GLZ36213.1 hypothetical protein Lesp02_84000 [Lentzea sp. NBRC 105346]
MAIMVLTASYLSLAGTNVSDHTKKIELAAEVDEKDVTTFASLGWVEVKGGLKKGSLAATFLQDVAAGQIDSMMWPLLGTNIAFEVRLDNAAVGASNPKYTGSVLVKKWTPIAGAPGDVAEVDVEYPTSGAITRATA